MGELLNAFHEEGLLISLICHAPVTMTSTKYSVSETGTIETTGNRNFQGAKITVVSKGDKKNGFSGRLSKSSGKENPCYLLCGRCPERSGLYSSSNF